MAGVFRSLSHSQRGQFWFGSREGASVSFKNALLLQCSYCVEKGAKGWREKVRCGRRAVEICVSRCVGDEAVAIQWVTVQYKDCELLSQTGVGRFFTAIDANALETGNLKCRWHLALNHLSFSLYLSDAYWNETFINFLPRSDCPTSEAQYACQTEAFFHEGPSKSDKWYLNSWDGILLPSKTEIQEKGFWSGLNCFSSSSLTVNRLHLIFCWATYYVIQQLTAHTNMSYFHWLLYQGLVFSIIC